MIIEKVFQDRRFGNKHFILWERFVSGYKASGEPIVSHRLLEAEEVDASQKDAQLWWGPDCPAPSILDAYRAAQAIWVNHSHLHDEPHWLVKFSTLGYDSDGESEAALQISHEGEVIEVKRVDLVLPSHFTI